MKTSLRVIFDTSNLTEDFIIENVSVIPVHGEHFLAVWTDFISDLELLKEIDEFEQEEPFVTTILSKRYSKDHVLVSVILVSQKDFDNHNY
jgi:NDP-sugar pyrophosphorylase family protein